MLCKFLAATSHFFLSKISMGCNKFLPTKELPNASKVHSIFLLVVGLSVKIWCKAAGLNLQLVWGKGVCSDLNWTAQQLQMVVQKLGNNVRHDSDTIATKVCSQIGSKWNVMSESNVVTSVDRQAWFSIWRFFAQSAFANIHLLCCQTTIHNLILKICPKFEVISSHFFEVNELLNKHWAKFCQVKIFQLQSMSNAIRCTSIDQRFAFKISCISCLVLIFYLNNPRTTVLYARKSVAGGEIRESYFSSIWYEPMGHWLGWVVESGATWVRILMKADICRGSAVLRGTEPVSALIRALLFDG